MDINFKVGNWEKLSRGFKCPHCKENIFPEAQKQNIEINPRQDTEWAVIVFLCPGCLKISLFLSKTERIIKDGMVTNDKNESTIMVYPRRAARSPLSKEVPNEYAMDYEEASLILVDSPKASAALSRRCLQNILRNESKVKPRDLDSEINEVLERKEFPTYVSSGLDAARVIGNFAAHPIKSTNTGSLVPVEPGEADWTLDVLESLFDFYFVQPKLLEEKRNALNKKLRDAGKPELK